MNQEFLKIEELVKQSIPRLEFELQKAPKIINKERLKNTAKKDENKTNQKQPENKILIRQCDECEKYFISKTVRKQRFCPGNKCRMSYHNRKRIRSGEAKEYKRKKRKEGARESYYG